jgi:hypothetical protein
MLLKVNGKYLHLTSKREEREEREKRERVRGEM